MIKGGVLMVTIFVLGFYCLGIFILTATISLLTTLKNIIELKRNPYPVLSNHDKRFSKIQKKITRSINYNIQR